MNDTALYRYYHDVFPVENLCTWLQSNCPSKDLSYREFASFKGDIPKRPLSFPNADALYKFLITELPDRIEIGAVYKDIPVRGAKNVPEQKEFVMDIDITDYDVDALRSCMCKGQKQMCKQCWPLLQCAIHVIDHWLRVLKAGSWMWCFSGRRGVHLWCQNPEWSKFTRTARQNIWELMRPKKRELLLHHPIHTLVYTTILLPYYRTLTELHGYLDTLEQQRIFLREFTAFLDTEQREIQSLQLLTNRWESECKTSIERLNMLVTFVASDKCIFPQAFQCALHLLIATKIYPKIDMPVTEDMGHLLKAPFCVHPDTLLVSMPIADPLNCTFEELTATRWDTKSRRDFQRDCRPLHPCWIDKASS
jgi:DNA primase small subunit